MSGLGPAHGGEDAKVDHNGTRTLILVDADTGEILNPLVETDPTRAIRVAPYVWDPNLMDFVKMQQPILEVSGDLTVTMGDVEALLSGHYYKEFFPYQYSPSNRIKYACKNTTLGAVLSATDWLVWKFTDAGIPRKQGPRVATGGIATEGAIDALAWTF